MPGANYYSKGSVAVQKGPPPPPPPSRLRVPKTKKNNLGRNILSNAPFETVNFTIVRGKMPAELSNAYLTKLKKVFVATLNTRTTEANGVVLESAST